MKDFGAEEADFLRAAVLDDFHLFDELGIRADADFVAAAGGGVHVALVPEDVFALFGLLFAAAIAGEGLRGGILDEDAAFTIEQHAVAAVEVLADAVDFDDGGNGERFRDDGGVGKRAAGFRAKPSTLLRSSATVSEGVRSRATMMTGSSNMGVCSSSPRR